MLQQLAQDYSAFLRVDISKELGEFEETTEDMLTRLEEFESLMNMVRSDVSTCVAKKLPEILATKDKLNELFNKIDKLENFVERVHHELDVIESQVDTAETDLVVSTDNKLKTMFKPLFFKKSAAEPVVKKELSYEPATIFNSDQVFQKNNQPNEEGKS